MPEKPYSCETLNRIVDMLPRAEIFFVMGADSWMEITTWRAWQEVLSLTNHIVVTRPGYTIGFDHVTDEIRNRIVDMRNGRTLDDLDTVHQPRIFFTDAVSLDLSATEIRQKIRDKGDDWSRDVPVEVANYIEKYQIYS
jgi:nicotinate-nucleotide adenylyltransferase